ncbi:hypothetical protein [Micromonospora sp. RP3T]|uniref:hypothetical protein n=1 Tax=Micromonospora sp. RP3T TaxID=2135446 RepID=UPI003D75CF97
MSDTDQPTPADQSPGVTVVVAAMRALLRTRHDSPGDGPEALEEWTGVEGWSWRWSTDAGLWRVTVGGTSDPRPALRGPAGYWRVDAEPGPVAVDQILALLGVADAVPAEQLPPAPPAAGLNLPRVSSRRRLLIRGETFTADPQMAEPVRALVRRAGDPDCEVPDGYTVVRAVADEPDEHGRWLVTLPDGYHQHRYDPAGRRCLVPYDAGDDRTALLLFEPGQKPGIRTVLGTRDGGMLSWPAQVNPAQHPDPALVTYTPPPAEPEPVAAVG